MLVFLAQLPNFNLKSFSELNFIYISEYFYFWSFSDNFPAFLSSFRGYTDIPQLLLVKSLVNSYLRNFAEVSPYFSKPQSLLRKISLLKRSSFKFQLQREICRCLWSWLESQIELESLSFYFFWFSILCFDFFFQYFLLKLAKIPRLNALSNEICAGLIKPYQRRQRERE